jgi:Predicted membrane protein
VASTTSRPRTAAAQPAAAPRGEASGVSCSASFFFVPFAGLALGAGFGALFGHLGEKAIDKEFQNQVRDQVQPGTSALFMIIEKATPDKAIDALKGYGGTVIKTSLSEEDTQKLQEALTPTEQVGASS